MFATHRRSTGREPAGGAAGCRLYGRDLLFARVGGHVRRLVVALLVLVGLLVAADFAAAAAAESAVSRQLRAQLGLSDDPSVRINGFPFLTQAIAGDYRSVDVSANHIRLGELRDVEVGAQLRDVRAPLSELLGSGPKTIRVDQAYGTVRISAADLARLIPGVDKLRIENIDDTMLEQAVEEGGDNSLIAIDPGTAARIAGTATVPGLGNREFSVIAVLQITGGQIEVVPRYVRVNAVGGGDRLVLPAQVQRELQALLTVHVDPGTLPFHVTPTRLRARDGTLEITGTTSGLVLGGGAAAAGR